MSSIEYQREFGPAGHPRLVRLSLTHPATNLSVSALCDSSREGRQRCQTQLLKALELKVEQHRLRVQQAAEQVVEEHGETLDQLAQS